MRLCAGGSDGDALGWNGTFDDAESGFVFEPELTAGGGDIVAFFAAQSGGDAGIGEYFQEGVLLGFVRALPGEAFDGIVGDEIDLGLHAAGAFHQ